MKGQTWIQRDRKGVRPVDTGVYSVSVITANPIHRSSLSHSHSTTVYFPVRISSPLSLSSTTNRHCCVVSVGSADGIEYFLSVAASISHIQFSIQFDLKRTNTTTTVSYEEKRGLSENHRRDTDHVREMLPGQLHTEHYTVHLTHKYI